MNIIVNIFAVIGIVIFIRQMIADTKEVNR